MSWWTFSIRIHRVNILGFAEHIQLLSLPTFSFPLLFLLFLKNPLKVGKKQVANELYKKGANGL